MGRKVPFFNAVSPGLREYRIRVCGKGLSQWFSLTRDERKRKEHERKGRVTSGETEETDEVPP